MPFVVDASVAASWLLPNESDAGADAAYNQLDADEAVALWLWWFEVRNIFVVSERRGRLNTVQTDRALAFLAKLPIRTDQAPNEAAILQLDRRHRLTGYNAAYLELALRGGLPLATLDAALATAARAEAVSLLEG